jgi:hypothetical protein
MGLCFAYRRGRSPRPVVSLGGSLQRPRPIVDVTLIGPATSIVRAALLDTGADDTVFTQAEAQLLGLDLSQAPQYTVAGVGSPPYVIAYAPITLRLTNGVEYREWPALVGFTSARMILPVLGFAGCLQYFDALSRGQREVVELTVNGLFPGK